MDLRFPYSPAEVAKVKVVQFGILSPDEIRQMSVVHIEHSETTERGKPKPGGLSDPRLGTIDRKMKCETCMANMAECPGHFGHLELAKPMFHIGFMKIVLSIMRCVCFNCSKVLADEDDTKFKQALRIKNPKHRLRKILDACKNKTKCEGGDEIDVDGGHSTEEPTKKSKGGCGAQQPKITIDGMKMVAEYKAQRKKSDDQEQLPEPVERNQQMSAEKQCATCLSEVEQSPPKPFLEALQPFLDAVVKPELLKHQDREVNLLVATCICEITRITAPQASYADDILKDIFRLIVGTFNGLSDLHSPFFGRRVVILETLAKYRPFVVMLDLECDHLVKEIFTTFFAIAHPLFLGYAKIR